MRTSEWVTAHSSQWVIAHAVRSPLATSLRARGACAARMSGRRRGGVLSSPDRVSRRAAERQGLSHHQRASGPAAPTHRHTHSPGRELLEVAGGLYVEARSDRGKRAGNRRSHKRTGSSATVRGPTSQQHEPAARVSPRRVHRTSPSRTRHAEGGAQRANPHLDASFAPIEVSAAGRPPAELAARDGRFQVATPRDDSGWEPSPLRPSNGLTGLQVAAVEETFGAMNSAVMALQSEWELGRQEVQERLAETVGEKVRLRGEVEALKAEHARMIDDMRQLRVSCTAALKEQQANKGAAWARAVAANEALAATSQQLSSLQSENTELREMLVGLARNLQQHRDAAAAEAEERRRLQRQLQKLEEQNADEALRFVDFDNSLDAALTECARHKARAEAMDEKCAKYDVLDARCERFGSENRRLEAENARLKTEHLRFAEENAQNMQELAGYRQQHSQQALVQWAKDSAKSKEEAAAKDRQRSNQEQEQLLVQWAKANAPQYPKPRRIQVSAAKPTQLPNAFACALSADGRSSSLCRRRLPQHKRSQQRQGLRLRL